MFWTDPSFLTTALIVALAIQWIPARKNSSSPNKVRIPSSRNDRRNGPKGE